MKSEPRKTRKTQKLCWDKREYGDKEIYREVFRNAYLEGYQAGYKALDAAL